MGGNWVLVFLLLGLLSSTSLLVHVNGVNMNVGSRHFRGSYRDGMPLHRLASLGASNAISAEPSPAPFPSPPLGPPSSVPMPPRKRVYNVIDYGADPTGVKDSTDAILDAISDAFRPPDKSRMLIQGVVDLGGAEVDLQGGLYKISRPLRLPSSGGGNFMLISFDLNLSNTRYFSPVARSIRSAVPYVEWNLHFSTWFAVALQTWTLTACFLTDDKDNNVNNQHYLRCIVTVGEQMEQASNRSIHGGSLVASDDFPTDRHLIELWPSSSPKLAAGLDLRNSLVAESFANSYEYITLRDLLLDANYRGGGVAVVHSLRTTITTCYITRFATDGVLVQGGHETFISNSFLGQHITAGGDPGERNFTGTAISLMGNDNAVTDVVIFSAAVGVLVAGQANALTGVHCYNKATGFGGVGIYVRLPGLSQTRIENCYLDYTGIVAEDPVQLYISGSFFLGNAFVLFKSVKGVIRGVSVVDCMFSGDGSGVEVVQLEQTRAAFATVDEVVVERNSAEGMRLRSTVGRGRVGGNGTRWAVDFSGVLLFPDLMRNVQYSFEAVGGDSNSFPRHALRNVSMNRVVVESDVPVAANVYVVVDQTSPSIGAS
ncbi:hypothetical protein ACLOJK_041480 [Asimina triloba]